MNYPRALGLHYRLTSSYYDLAELAHRSQSTAVQFFLYKNNSKHHLDISSADSYKFNALVNTRNMRLFAHSSLRINLASEQIKEQMISRFVLEKELEIAQKLNIPYLVLHPGHIRTIAKNQQLTQTDRIHAIKQLADLLTKALDNKTITILLENSAHGGCTLGNTFDDFALVQQIAAHPQIKYCIDTAHAFSYGYDIANTEKFVAHLDETIGLSNIGLIHCNDNVGARGSLIDHHAFPGEGLIGSAALAAFINHPSLSHVPIIIETPPIDQAHALSLMNHAQQIFFL